MAPPTWRQISKICAKYSPRFLDGRGICDSAQIGYGASPVPVQPGDMIGLDGGGALEVLPQGTPPAKRLIQTSASAPAILRFAGNARMDIAAFGARDGEDCTVAIDAAMAEAAHYQRTITELGAYPATADGPAVHIPAGRFHYDGAGFDRSIEGSAKAFSIRGEHRGASFIVMQSDVHLLTTHDVNSLTFEHFSLIGGKGLWVGKSTAGNVRGGVYANNLLIKNFTEVALGHASSDFPNIYINHCQIEGLADVALFGLCFPGLTDEVLIHNNTIGSCRYGIKLGHGGNNAKILNNGLFVTAHPAGMSADIWLVARNVETNAGLGLVIANNKFGPEGIEDDTTTRILIADEDAGAGSLSWQRPHTAAQSSGYVVGTKITGNAFYGNAMHRDGLIYATTHRLPGLTFDENTIAGHTPSKIIEYSPEVIAAFEAGSLQVRSGGRVGRPTQGVITPGGTTRPANMRGAVVPASPDHYGGMEGAIDVARGWIGEPDVADFVPVLGVGGLGEAWTAAAAVTSGIDDPFGGSGAVRVDPQTGVEARITLPNMRAALLSANIPQGALAWVETWVRSAGGAGAFAGLVYGSTFDRVVNVIAEGPAWQLVRFPVTLTRLAAETGSPQIRIGIPASRAVNGQPIDFYGARMYVARSPVNAGHLRTAGATAGAWDGPHVILGGHHLWLDSAGALRKKLGAPASETDGSLVSEDAAGAGGVTVEGRLTGRDSLAAPAASPATLYTLGLRRSFTHCLVTIEILAWNNTAYLKTEHRIYLRNNSVSNDTVTDVLSVASVEKGRYDRPASPAIALGHTVAASVVGGLAAITVTPGAIEQTLRVRARFEYATPPIDAGVGVFEH